MQRIQNVTAVYNGMGMRFMHLYTVAPYADDDHARVAPIDVLKACPQCGCPLFDLRRDSCPAEIVCSSCGKDLRGMYLAHTSIRYTRSQATEQERIF